MFLFCYCFVMLLFCFLFCFCCCLLFLGGCLFLLGFLIAVHVYFSCF